MLIAIVECLHAAPRVQLSVSADNSQMATECHAIPLPHANALAKIYRGLTCLK